MHEFGFFIKMQLSSLCKQVMWWQLILTFKTIKTLPSTFNDRKQQKSLWTLTLQKLHVFTTCMHCYSPIQSLTVTLTFTVSVLTESSLQLQDHSLEKLHEDTVTTWYHAEAAVEDSTDFAMLLYHQKYNNSWDEVVGVYWVYKCITRFGVSCFY